MNIANWGPNCFQDSWPADDRLESFTAWSLFVFKKKEKKNDVQKDAPPFAAKVHTRPQCWPCLDRVLAQPRSSFFLLLVWLTVTTTSSRLIRTLFCLSSIGLDSHASCTCTCAHYSASLSSNLQSYLSIIVLPSLIDC